MYKQLARYFQGYKERTGRAVSGPEPEPRFKACPVCKAKVRAERYSKHLSQTHRLRLPDEPRTPVCEPAHKRPAPEPRVPLALCPVCDIRMKPERLAEHRTSRSHRDKERRQAEEQALVRIGIAAEDLVSCPECRLPVAGFRLPKHLRAEHGKSITAVGRRPLRRRPSGP